LARGAQVGGLAGAETNLREVDEGGGLARVDLERRLELRGGEAGAVGAHQDDAVVVAGRGEERLGLDRRGEVSLGRLEVARAVGQSPQVGVRQSPFGAGRQRPLEGGAGRLGVAALEGGDALLHPAPGLPAGRVRLRGRRRLRPQRGARGDHPRRSEDQPPRNLSPTVTHVL
jgi:hypothetical protein